MRPGNPAVTKDRDDNNPKPMLSAVDRVIAEIKTGIREGLLVPGQRLVEPDLSDAIRVSRGSIREALHRLAAQGLVQLEQYRGASVSKMSRREALELNNIRAVLEGHAAAQAASLLKRSDRKQLLQLERLWDGGKEFPSYNEYNEQFHNLIMNCGQNSHLPEFVQGTKLGIFRLQFQLILLTPKRISASRIEHNEIVEAILNKDSTGAEKKMRQHINNTANVILSAPDRYFS